MNILRVIASMDPSTGGPCQGIRNAIPELQKLGGFNEVVCLDPPDSSFFGKDNFPIHPLGSGKSPWNYNKKLSGWLMKNLGRFDVVIVHGLWLYHSYAVKQALSRYKKLKKKAPRFFIMPHGMLDPYFQQAPDRKLKALRNWVYWKLIEASVVNKADGVLFTCEAERRLARVPFLPYQPIREINIGYGITEPPSFTSVMRMTFLEKCPELENGPYFLFLSRIHEKKGVDLLIKAYLEMIETTLRSNAELISANFTPEVHSVECPNYKWPMLVVAGPGLETTYGEKMQKLVGENTKLKNAVVFPGMLTGDAKWGAFYGCEAFVLPSHQENFGIAVVEALACRKPVLVSNQVNIWQEIEAAGGGIVAEDTFEGTVRLFKSWQNLSKEEKLLQGIHARICYEKKFAIRPHLMRLLDAIR